MISADGHTSAALELCCIPTGAAIKLPESSNPISMATSSPQIESSCADQSIEAHGKEKPFVLAIDLGCVQADRSQARLDREARLHLICSPPRGKTGKLDFTYCASKFCAFFIDVFRVSTMWVSSPRVSTNGRFVGPGWALIRHSRLHRRNPPISPHGLYKAR